MKKFSALTINVLISLFTMICVPIKSLSPEAQEKGFVYLDEIDPSIQVILRYATDDNFVGHPLPGYNITNRAIMTIPIAHALEEYY